MVTIDQAVPFQCAARVTKAEVLFICPTAQQSDTLVQATALNSLFCEELVLGVGTMDQALPFQCSAKVWAAAPLLPYPTAQQSELLAQLTPPIIWEALGVVTFDQTVPFQWSASISPVAPPTAQQSELLTQLTRYVELTEDDDGHTCGSR